MFGIRYILNFYYISLNLRTYNRPCVFHIMNKGVNDNNNKIVLNIRINFRCDVVAVSEQDRVLVELHVLHLYQF